MKYMQNGGFQNHPLMRLTLAWALLLLTGFWITNFFFYFSKMGLTPQSVVDYYRGSEALFTQPRSLQSMIEVTHGHLPVMAVVLLMLTHLLIFAPLPHRVKVAFISLTFGSAFLNEGASWLVRFVHPGFAWLKIGAFVTLQALIAYLLVGLARFLWRAAQEDKPRRRGRRAEDDL
jgi:hypothetical protein